MRNLRSSQARSARDGLAPIGGRQRLLRRRVVCRRHRGGRTDRRTPLARAEGPRSCFPTTRELEHPETVSALFFTDRRRVAGDSSPPSAPLTSRRSSARCSPGCTVGARGRVDDSQDHSEIAESRLSHHQAHRTTGAQQQVGIYVLIPLADIRARRQQLSEKASACASMRRRSWLKENLQPITSFFNHGAANAVLQEALRDGLVTTSTRERGGIVE